MSFFSSLTRTQKQAIGLLQIGTALELFDLMLYVHMAVILNELFFPKTDPHTASLLASLAFCSTFVLRPIGALLFGYIGDHIGRKATVTITTTLMAISCILMANLPTYAEVGISAAVGVTLCRVVQGISSMGEMVGAEVYLTEITKPPVRYPAVAALTASADFGAMLALGVASLVLAITFNWRVAFWVGAGIAVVGVFARRNLRETPEFLKKKQLKKNALNKINSFEQEKIDKKALLALFLMFSAWPVGFYFSYIHCAQILENSFGYTAEQVIQQNLCLSILQLCASVVFVFLSFRIYPLKIVKFNLRVYYLLIFICPLCLARFTSPFQLFWLQAGIAIFSEVSPATAIFYAHFPVLKRITVVGVTYAIARALMYIITSFGFVYLTTWFGNFGLWIIMIPVTLAFTWAILYFEKLDKPERDVWRSMEKKGSFERIENPILKEAA